MIVAKEHVSAATSPSTATTTSTCEPRVCSHARMLRGRGSAAAMRTMVRPGAMYERNPPAPRTAHAAQSENVTLPFHHRAPSRPPWVIIFVFLASSVRLRQGLIWHGLIERSNTFQHKRNARPRHTSHVFSFSLPAVASSVVPVRVHTHSHLLSQSGQVIRMTYCHGRH